MPVALENYAPASASKKKVIWDALEESQFYLIILGARYGSIPEDDPDGKGYVEIELDIARELRLKTIVFVMDITKVMEFRKTDEFVNSAEAKLVDKYDNLRKNLTKGINNVFYREFETASDIEKWTLAYFQNPCSEVPGYIPEPVDRKDTEILSVYAKNEIIRDVVLRLGQFETVEPRLASEANKKLQLARAFADVWGRNVQDKYKRVFLESGSTLTYVAKELVKYLPRQEGGKSSPEVITNNAFAYLYLWLCSEVLCHPVPSGSPDRKYAGMYGKVSGRKRTPTYDMTALKNYDPDAPHMISDLKKEIFGEDAGETTLILAAESGIQLTDDITAVTIDEDNIEHPLEPGDELWNEVSQCRGFHVGSYENHLFKRSYYLTKSPAILFAHDKKIDCKIIVGRCHFLCDSGMPWSEFIQEHPLSIWVACSKDTYQHTLSKCRSGFTHAAGWKFGVYGLGTPFPIVIGSNEAFSQSCQDIEIELPTLSSGHDDIPQDSKGVQGGKPTED